ncbi:hypothetical protein [Humidesulfovibrio sp.]
MTAARSPFRAEAPAFVSALALGLALTLACALALPAIAQAHGTGSRWLEGQAAPLAVLFHYSTGEPMSWVAAKVYGPGDTSMEYQAARTDKAGVLAFVPDRPGAWRVEVLDDQGHKAVAETNVDAALAHSAQPGGQAASPLRSAALGLSILLNISLGLMLWRRTRASKPPA